MRCGATSPKMLRTAIARNVRFTLCSFVDTVLLPAQIDYLIGGFFLPAMPRGLPLRT